MSLIKPFNGIRPQKKYAKAVSFPNINYLNNYKPNKKLNFLNILNNKSILKAKKILQKLEKKKNYQTRQLWSLLLIQNNK